jgi:hypothetical protein
MHHDPVSMTIKGIKITNAAPFARAIGSIGGQSYRASIRGGGGGCGRARR